ncbi:glycosyl hydrolase family 18 protein [Paenibacillus roseus]|uniref:glycosyl hydrolase family 18 protein n=1 Tax=Paenibacillus sp. GCM10012307 TaxID=3317343 RepID=UPI0036D2A5D1
MLLCIALLLGSVLNASILYAADDETSQQPAEAPKAPQNLRITEGTLTHDSVGIEWDFIGTDLDPQNPNNIDIWNADTDASITYGHLWKRAIGGLKPETTYRIYITWDERPATRLHKSNIVEFTTLADTSEYKKPPLTPPQNLKVSAVTDSGITFTWQGSPGASGYDFYVNDGWNGGVWNGSDSYYTFAWPEGSAPGTAYKFEVAAQQKIGDGPLETSEKSNTVRLIQGELATAKDVQVITANRTTAVIGWASVPGATEYDIYQDEQLVGTSDSNRYTASGLTEGQSYSFTVVARNDLWTSAASEPTVAVPGANYTNVTYYTQWSIYDRKFYPSDIDVSQVTHINYAFADVCWNKKGTNPNNICQNDELPLQKDYVYNGEIIIGDPEADPANFAAFADIKQANPDLKLLVSVGGWSWSRSFSDVAADEITRRTFANSAVKFLREYKLDGLDIDWEYPVEGGETHNIHRPEDKQNFTLLMKTLREALDAAGSEDGKYYLLTIASGQSDSFVVNADLANSVSYLDFINIMTYDFGGSWEKLANHNAPLYYDSKLPKSSAPRSNVRGGAVGHLNGGVPEHKLVLGLPFYGKGWSGCAEPGQYVTCTGVPPGTWESGVFDYHDVVTNYVGQNGYVRYWNEAAKVAYLYSPETQQFITYNDRTTMIYSASLVKTLNLAGVMSWEVSADRERVLLRQLNRDLPANGRFNEQALEAPAHLSVNQSKSTSLKAQWNTVAGATGYEVFINHAYAGYTTSTEFEANDLQPNTTYDVYVFAIRKSDDQIEEVSPASKTGSVRIPSNIYYPSAPVFDTSKTELDVTTVKDQDTLRLTVTKNAGVQTINANKDNDSYTITVQDDAAASTLEVFIPKEVADALAEKGKQALLTVIWNGVSYQIPAPAINRSADIKITLAPPGTAVATDITKFAKDSQLKLVGKILELKVEVLGTDGKYAPPADILTHTFKRSYTLDGKPLNNERLTAVVYLPDGKEFRAIPTAIIKGTDGKLHVEFTQTAGSLNVIVESLFQYEDVSAEWARKAVERATAKLITTGATDNHFGAATEITRGEFVSIIVRGLGVLPDYSEQPFQDVPAGSAYAGDIAAAKKLGIIQGRTADSFQPGNTLTRQEMATILGRVWQHAGLQADTDPSVLDRFTDKSAVSGYAKNSIALLVEKGILQGVSATRFSPQANLTKAQAVVAVIRLLDAAEQSK